VVIVNHHDPADGNGNRGHDGDQTKPWSFDLHAEMNIVSDRSRRPSRVSNERKSGSSGEGRSHLLATSTCHGFDELLKPERRELGVSKRSI
jgi:hypothetical protein